MIGRHFAGNSTVSRSVAETVYFLSAPGSWNPNSSDFWLKICSSLASKAFLPAIYKSKLDKWALTQDQKSPPPLVAPVIGGVFFSQHDLGKFFLLGLLLLVAPGGGWLAGGRAGPALVLLLLGLLLLPVRIRQQDHRLDTQVTIIFKLFYKILSLLVLRKNFSGSAVPSKFWIVSIKLTNISQGKIKLHFTI